MKVKGLFLAAIFILVSLSATAEPIEYSSESTGELSILESPAFKFDKKRTSKNENSNIIFSGKTTLTGVLQFFWMTPSEGQKDLGINFIPDEKSLSQLPTIKEGQRTIEPKIIQLDPSPEFKKGYHYSESKILNILKDKNKRIPENFLKYKERYALLPAELEISKLFSAKDCDNRFFIATFTGVKNFPNEDLTEKLIQRVKDAEGCGSHPYDEYFIATSKSERFITVKSAPNSTSETKFKIPNGDSFLKLKTLNNEWMQIRFNEQEATETSNSKKSEGYIYTPDIKLELMN